MTNIKELALKVRDEMREEDKAVLMSRKDSIEFATRLFAARDAEAVPDQAKEIDDLYKLKLEIALLQRVANEDQSEINELRAALEELMAGQVKHVQIWSKPTYDNAVRAIATHKVRNDGKGNNAEHGEQ